MAEPQTAKELMVLLEFGDDTATLHPEDRATAEQTVDMVEEAGWRIVPARRVVPPTLDDHLAGELSDCSPLLCGHITPSNLGESDG